MAEHRLEARCWNERLRRTSDEAPSGAAADCVARARELAPLIAAQADRIERQREIVPEVLAALHDARLFRMVLPRSVGGLEVDPVTLMQTIEEIAKADGSTAWCLSQASGCSVAAAYVAPEVAREVFGDARAVMASGPLGSDPKAVVGRGRLSGVRLLELRQRHQACELARLPLRAVRAGRHAAARGRRQAGRAHHAVSQGQRQDNRHLARGRPQGHRQRQLHDRGSVRPGRIQLHARVARRPPRDRTALPSGDLPSLRHRLRGDRARARARDARRLRRARRHQDSPQPGVGAARQCGGAVAGGAGRGEAAILAQLPAAGAARDLGDGNARRRRSR